MVWCLLLLVACGPADTPPGKGVGSSTAEWLDPVTGMEFVRIAAGTFLMGAPESEIGRQVDETLHEVTLSRDFYLGRYEVTQEVWESVMGSSPVRVEGCGPRCPVVNVNWLRIDQFIERLSELSDETFRLPTEAEWEYACRAGTTGPFSTGVNLTTAEANYDGRYPYDDFPAGDYRGRPLPVGTLPSNPWGLYDLHGNVWEWTLDDYCPYDDLPVVDPRGSCGGKKVIRGGSWYFNAESARSALRYTHDPRHIGPSLGFRLVREQPTPR